MVEDFDAAGGGGAVKRGTREIKVKGPALANYGLERGTLKFAKV